MSSMKAAVLGLLVFMMVLSSVSPLAAAPVPVRFVEGAVHGFLALRTLDGVLKAPGELFQVLRVARNLPKEASEIVHYVAFTPTPRLIQLEVAPAGEHKVLVGELAKTAIRYVFKPRLGSWLKLFTRLLGRMPPDSHAWIVP